MQTRRVLALTTAALLLTVGLSACGDDGGITEGAEAPSFALPSAAGGTVSLADYGDGPVLLFFHMADG